MSHNKITEEEDLSSSFTFNIENEAFGNQGLLNSFLDGSIATEDPDKVRTIKEEPKKEEAKKAVTKSEVKKEEPKKPDGTVLAEDFLSGKTKEDDSKEEEEEQSKEKKKEEFKEEESDFNPFSSFSKEMFKLNIFETEEGETEPEITSPEKFLERFTFEANKKAQKAINDFIGQFGEDYQNAFEAIYQKGVDPKDYFTTYNKIEGLAELDLTQEANQVAIVREFLSGELDSGDINAEIEKIKNYGDLEEKAKRYHKILAKKEVQKIQEMEDRKEQEQLQKTAVKQQFIRNVNTVLQEKLKNKEYDGIPINPQLAGQLQEFLLKDKYKLSSGETITEFDKVILDLKRPENHSLKVKVALLLKLLEKDPTLSTIQKKGLTNKTDGIFSEVLKQSKGSKTEAEKELPKWFV